MTRTAPISRVAGKEDENHNEEDEEEEEDDEDDDEQHQHEDECTRGGHRTSRQQPVLHFCNNGAPSS
jgi:hypothetical protein